MPLVEEHEWSGSTQLAPGYVAAARRDFPNGYYCMECGETNYWADDCGWFCHRDTIVCERCYRALGWETAER